MSIIRPFLNPGIIKNINPPIAGGGGGGTEFARDAFTDADATALENHTPTTSGGTWNAGTANGLRIGSNHVYCDNSGAGFRYWLSADPGTTDYWCEIQLTTSSASQVTIGPSVRISTTLDTCYFVRCNAGTWELYSRIAGTTGGIGTNFAGDDPSVAPRVCRLQATGNVTVTITVFIDGVQRIQTTDTGITSGGRAGLFSYFADDDNGVARYGDLLVASTTA